MRVELAGERPPPAGDRRAFVVDSVFASGMQVIAHGESQHILGVRRQRATHAESARRWAELRRSQSS